MNVTVIIKSATQSVDDFGVDCELSWTIGRLKEILEESYPDNPKKETQKLIYGGKLLPDHLSLKSILNHMQERHIMHLVYPLPFKASADESKKAAPQSFPVPPINPGFSPLNPPSFGAMPGMATVTSINTGDTFQQYVAVQQMYAQFMTQYLSQYNGGVPPVVPYAPVMHVPQTPPQRPVSQYQLTPIQRRRALQEERDYLDFFYSVSRALLLLAVLYYYSSVNRILIVVLMFICISVYIKLSRQIQHRQQEMQRSVSDEPRTQSISTEQMPADIQPAEVEEPVTAENDEDASTPSAESNTNDETISQQVEQRSFTSAMSTTMSLISVFFSSLIPSDPAPVNVN